MWPANSSLDNSPGSVTSELMAPGDSVYVPEGVNSTPAQPQSLPRLNFIPLPRLNRLAAGITSAVFLVLILVGVVTLLLTGNGKPPKSLASQASNYAVGNLAQKNLSNNTPALQLGQVSELQINGQLEISKNLVLSPSSTPTKPVSGEIYYNQATNSPYYFNGSSFESLAPTKSVTALGGTSGNIAVGSGLQVTNGQLSISSQIAQAVSSANTGPTVNSLQGKTGDITLSGGPGIAINGTTISASGALVTSFQGQTGNVTLTAGTGIKINGTTISLSGTGNGVSSLNNLFGDISINGSSNEITVNNNSIDGSITLSTPQAIDVTSSPTFNELTLSSLGTTGVVHTNALGQLSTSAVVLGADTSGSYINSFNATTGLTVLGDGGADSTPSISVNYGNAADTSVEGNTVLICPSGTGNLVGTGNAITLGSGGACNNLTITDSPDFSGSLTVEGSGGIDVGSSTNQGAVSFTDGTSDGYQGSLSLGGSNLTSNQTYTLPNASGTVCLSTGNCNGAGGVASVNGLTGALVLEDTTGELTFNPSGQNIDINLPQGLNVSSTPTFATLTLSSLNTPGVVHTNALGQLSTGPVVLGTDTSGDYVSSLGSVTGLTLSNNSGASATPGISVNYGDTADTSVEGNTTLTCASGSGNLSGGGNSVTLGDGGSCNLITITDSPTFTGNLSVQGSGGVVVGTTTTAGVLTLNDGYGDTTTFTAGNSGGSNLSFTLPTNYGSSGQCLTTDGGGSLSFADCLNGSNGVSSLNGLSGSLDLEDTEGQLTFSTAGQDININLPQGLTSADTPTFASLDLTSALAVIYGGTGSTTAGGARTNLGAAASGVNNDITSLTGLTVALPISEGGTGQTNPVSTGQLLIGTTAGGLTPANLTQGTSISITNGSGSISIGLSTSGVTAGSYGGPADVATFTVNAEGQLTSASSTPIAINGDQITSGNVGVAYGGTGLTSYSVGDLLYASGATTLSTLSDVSAGDCLVSGGVSTAPAWDSCAGTSGITGTGTSGDLALFSGANTLTSSALSQSSGDLTDSGTLTIQGTGGLILGNGSGSATIEANTSGTPTFVLPSNTGSSGQCLETNGIDNLSFGNCLSGATGGSGGVVSLNGLSGSLDLEDTEGQLTFSTAGQDININLPQGLTSADTPTFASLDLTSALAVIYGGTGSTTAGGARTNLGAAASGVNNDITSLTGLTVALPISEGGTGQTNPVSTGQLLIGTTAGGLTPANLTQGTSISITNGSGSISIGLSTSGVTAGSYGGPADVATFTVNAEGQLTSASSTPIAINGDQITSGNVGVAYGGTGLTSYSVGDLLYASGATTLSTLSDVSAGDCLVSGGVSTAPAWDSCAGTSGITGTGTSGDLALFSGANTLTSSALSQSSGDLTDSGTLTIQGTGGLILGNGSGSATIEANTSGTPTFVLPSNTGSSGQCLETNGIDNLSFGNCLSGATGGSGGVVSLNGLSGSLDLEDTEGQLTFSTAGQDININLPQGLTSADTPTFASLDLTSALAVIYGGTGSTTAGGARTNLGAAASGVNNDITSLTGLTVALPISEGGTGQTNPVSTGQLLIGTTAGGLTPANLTQGTSISITNGSGSISIGLSTSGVTAGSYGGPADVATFTVNAEGQLTSASSTPIAINGDQITSGNVGVAYGGTGLTSYSVGDLLYASGATTLSTLSDVSAGDCLVSGGVSTAPAWDSCAGTSGITGTGTSGDLALFSGANTLTSSALSQSSGDLTDSGTLTIQGTGGLILGNGSGSATIEANTSGTPTFVLPSNEGTSGQCLETDGYGNLSFTNCLSGSGGGSSGVSSLNGLSGSLDLEDTEGQLTFSTAGQDININLPQGLTSADTPTFASLDLTSALAVIYGGTGSTTAGGARTNLGAAASGVNNDITSLTGLTVALPISEGGTGQTNPVSTGQLLIGTTAGGLTPANLTQGTSISITNGSGSISIGLSTSGVTAGSYGGPADVATFTVNAEGQLTSASSTPIAINGDQITSGNVGVAYGGTGLTSYSVGDLLYASGATTLSTLSDVSAGDCLVSGGVSTAPAWDSCAGTSGITGTGTSGDLALFSGANTLTSSALSQSSGDLTDSGTLTIQGTGGLILGNGSGSATIEANTSGTPTFVLPSNTGSSGQCLETNGIDNLSFGNCLSGATGGSGGVVSLNGLSGSLDLEDTEGQLTFSTAGQDININLPQGLTSADTPTFASLDLTSALAVIYGGTGSTTAGGARTNLGAAASGVNNDITSLTGLTVALPISEGGTGQTNPVSTGQLLIGTTAGGLTPANLTQGTSISITNGSGSISIGLSTSGVTAGSYGGPADVATFTVNAEGQLTSASSTPIAINGDQITSGNVGVAYGGTGGTASPTAGGIAYGTGSAYAFTAVGTSGQCLTSAAAGEPTWGNCDAGAIIQAPTSTATNTITPATSGVVGLTVNGTNTGTAATALAIVQGYAATGQTITSSSTGDAEDISLTNASGTQTNGLSITRSAAGGGTTNLINLSNSGTSTANAITISGAYTNDLINSTNFSVTNAGAVTAGTYNTDTLNATSLQFSGAAPVISASTANTGLTLQANGTGTLTLNTTGAGKVNVGTTSTTTVDVGNSSAATVVSIQGGTTASAVSIQSGAAGDVNINASDTTAVTNIGTGSTTGAISIGGGSDTLAVNTSNWDITGVGVASGLTGLTSSGSINFSGLSTNGIVTTSGGTGTLSVVTSVPIANGGTGGTASPTAGGIAYGTGSAYAFTAVGTSGQCLTSAAAGEPTWGNCDAGAIIQAPTSTATNTITPATSGVVGLTVNGTNTGTAATALAIVQGYAATGQTITSSSTGDAEDISLTNASGTQTNGLSITRSAAGGGTTNLINLSNSGTSTANAITISGAYTNDLINSTNFSVTNAGAVTAGTYNTDTLNATSLQFSGGVALISASTANTGLTLQANGTGTLTLNTTGAGKVNVGTTSTTTVDVGNSSAATVVSIQGGTTASAVSIQSGAAGDVNINASDTTAVTNIGTGSTTGAISIGGGSDTLAVNTSNWDITGVGVASGLTGLTSSGSINFSGLSTNGIVTTSGGTGTLSVVTSVPIANGGTGGTASPTAGGIAYGTGSAYAFTAVGTSGQCLTSAAAGEPTWGNCDAGAIIQAPTSTATNTITPATSGVVGLTVNGTNTGTAATALAIVQGYAATGQTITSSSTGDAEDISLTNASGTQTNGLSITRSAAGGGTTNLINLSNSGTSTANAITISGAYTNDLINSTNFSVTNAGAVTAGTYNTDTLNATSLQFSGGVALISASTANTGLTLQANGTGTLTLNTTGAGKVNVGTTSTTTVDVGNSSAATVVSIQGGTTASAVSIQSGAAGDVNINASDTTAVTNIGTGSTTGAISIGGGSDTLAVNTSNWDITGVGVASGLTGLTSSGSINFSGLSTNGIVTTSGGTGTLSVVTSVPIANGGTGGTASPTAGGIAYGTGSAYAFTAVGTSGQCLTSAAAGEPTWGNCTPVNGTALFTLQGDSGTAQGVTTGSTVSINGDGGNISTTASATNKITVSITNAPTFSGLITGNGGTTISGAAINLNASSNNNTFINTGSSTGTVSIGGSSTGAIALQSASTITLTPSGSSNTGLVVKPTNSSKLAFSVQNTSSASVLSVDTTDGRVGINISGTPAYALDVNGQINSNTAVSVGGVDLCTVDDCIPAAGSTNYIQNGTTMQPNANLSISSASVSAVTATLLGASGQSADILDLDSWNGTSATILDSFNNNGSVVVKNLSNSTMEVQVQNATSGEILQVNSTSQADIYSGTDVGSIGINGASVTSGYALNIQGSVNATQIYEGGVGICLVTNNCTATGTAGGDLSGSYPDPEVAKLQNTTLTISSPSNGQVLAYNGTAWVNTNTVGNFTSKAVTDSINTFQVQNASGVSVLDTDTTDSSLIVTGAATPTGVTQAGSNVATGTNPSSVVVSGNYAYVVNYTSGTLQIFNISNPASVPAALSTTTTGTNPDNIRVSGNYAYVVNGGSNTLQVFNISNPASVPAALSTTTTGSDPDGITVSGNYAYVVNYTSGTLQIFNISNPASVPAALSTTTTGTNPNSVVVSGNYAYVVNGGSNTLQIFNISNPASIPAALSTTTTGSDPDDITVSGNYAYVVNYTSGTLQIFNISNPASVPAALSTTTTGTNPNGVAVSGNYAYVVNAGSSNTLQVFNISNPSSVTQVGSNVATGTNPYFVSVSGNYAYVVNYGSNTLQIFNVNPAPTLQIKNSAGASVLSVDTTGAGNLLNINNGNNTAPSNVLTLSNTGALSLENSANSTSAFQVQNAGGTSLLTVDTTDNLISTNADVAVKGVAASSFTTPTVVEQATASSSGGTATETFGSATTVGDTLVILGNVTSGYSTISSVSGGGVSQWHQITSTYVDSTFLPYNIGDWYGTVTSSGSTSVTETEANKGSDDVRVNATEISGIATPVTIDQSSGTATITATTFPTTPSITTSQSNDIVFAQVHDDTAADFTGGPTNGFTALTSPEGHNEGAYKVLTSPGSTSTAWTTTGSDQFETAITAFEASSSTNNVVSTTTSTNSTVSTIANSNGATTFQNSANSVSAFNIQDAAGNNVVNVDTTDHTLTVTASASSETVGTNLVTNVFNNGSDWTTSGGTGWTLTSSTAKYAGDASADTGYLTNDQFSTEEGETYYYSYTVSGDSNSISYCATLVIGNSWGPGACSNGNYSGYITSAQSSAQAVFWIYPPASATWGTISNVVIEPATVNNQSALTINNSLGQAILQVNAPTDAPTDLNIGYEAGQQDIQGSQNTAVGYQALQTGADNDNITAIGYQAAQYSDNAYDDVAIGTATLQYNTSGGANIAVGDNALKNNANANNNTALGYNSLNQNVSGNNNTAVGYESLYSGGGGNDNAALGYQALYSNNSGGSHDTGLGYEAQVAAGGINGSTAVGAYSDVTQSNSLVLGCISGTNGCTTSTEIGIGTAAPAATLNVIGNDLFQSSTNSTTALVVEDSSGGADFTVSTAGSPDGGSPYADVMIGGSDADYSELDLKYFNAPEWAIGTDGGIDPTNSYGPGGFYLWNDVTRDTDFGVSTTGQADFRNSTNSTTAFQVQDTGATEVLDVDTSNDRVGIGTNGPSATLNVVGNVVLASGTTTVDLTSSSIHGICKNNSGTGNFVLMACSSAPTADYAELYPTDGSVSAGDIVMPDGNYVTSNDGNNYQLPELTDTTSSYASTEIGVISQQTLAQNDGDSTLSGNDFSASDNPMALALDGRVLTKVDTENGDIEPGDYITASDTPGVGMKATDPGEVVGQALQAYDGSGTGEILVLVNPSYYAGTSMTSYVQNGGNATLNDLTVGGTADFNNLNASGLSTISDLNVQTLAVTDNITVGGNLSVTGLTSVADIQINGHIITAGGEPTGSVQAAAGTGATVTISGDDTTGTISITTGSSPTSGALSDIIFSKAYGDSPHVVLSPSNAAASNLHYFKGTTTNTDFMLNTTDTPSANTTYQFDYFIAQ